MSTKGLFICSHCFQNIQKLQQQNDLENVFFFTEKDSIKRDKNHSFVYLTIFLSICLQKCPY